MPKKKTNDISPPFPRVLRLDGRSKKWVRKESGVKGYTSEDNDSIRYGQDEAPAPAEPPAPQRPKRRRKT